MFDVPEGGENAKLVGKTVLVDVEGDIGGMEEHWNYESLLEVSPSQARTEERVSTLTPSYF